MSHDSWWECLTNKAKDLRKGILDRAQGSKVLTTKPANDGSLQIPSENVANFCNVRLAEVSW